MADTILQTKLHVPQLRSSLVPRPRLTDILDAGMDARLILVSAQAGSGKTTLVAEWLANLRLTIDDFRLNSRGGQIENRKSKIVNQVAWLSLDESDNDPRRFLDYLFAALRQIQVNIGKPVEAILQSPQPPPPEVILTALVNELSAIPNPFLLVLDDYHVIRTPSIHEQLNFLLEHQPLNVHLVITTREDPPLSLSRLRARGQLTEIRQADLRFTSDECADFLQRVMGLNLSSNDVADLERRTEGWIAGLQLAALSMRGHEDVSGFIQAFTGSSRFILDYLMEEVFERQTPDVKDFLLKTSILERLSAPLCDAVINDSDRRSPITDSRTILESLEHSNLFIIPLDQSRTWYRYHRLFADLLHQRLQTAGTLSEAELHRLASQWFEKAGFFAEAIGHSLAASDWERAGRLIDDQSTALLGRGESITLVGWLKSIPEDEIRTRPNLCLDYGWALVLTGQFDAAEPFWDCAERLSQNRKEQLGQVLIAQAYLARARREFAKAIELSERGLTLIAKSDIVSRCLAEFTLGFLYYAAEDYDKAEPALEEACQAARATGNDFVRQTALGMLGDMQRDRGSQNRAAGIYRQALEEARGSPTSARAQIYLADILYEWNDLTAAEDQLEQALKSSLYLGSLEAQANAYRGLYRLKQAQGDLTGAQEAMDKIRQMAQDNNFDLLHYYAAACQAELALAQGNTPLAVQNMQLVNERLKIEADVLNKPMVLMQAKLLFAQGKKREAEALAVKLYKEGEKVGWIPYMIDTRLLQALAAETPVEALQFLREALTLVGREKFIRTFIDFGEPMRLLLERMKAEGGEFKDYVVTLLSAFGEKKVEVSKNQPLVEAMSERELEILRLMAEGLSNRDIAERLVITVGTTKSHVHHILEKLGTESRMQATAKARELGLV